MSAVQNQTPLRVTEKEYLWYFGFLATNFVHWFFDPGLEEAAEHAKTDVHFKNGFNKGEALRLVAFNRCMTQQNGNPASDLYAPVTRHIDTTSHKSAVEFLDSRFNQIIANGVTIVSEKEKDKTEYPPYEVLEDQSYATTISAGQKALRYFMDTLRLR
jgi:hypothetical protein